MNTPLTPPHPTVMRVASVNLWGWFCDWPARLDVLVRDWPQINADVVFLQEVCHRDDCDQLAQVKRGLGYRFSARAYAQDVSAEHGREGVAILSRFPLRATEILPLPASAPGRCLLLCKADVGGRVVSVACAHTAFGPPAVREKHLDALGRLVADRDRIILGGDLNAPPQLVLPRLAAMGLRECLSRRAKAVTWPTCPQRFRAAWRQQAGRAPHFSTEPRRLDYVAYRAVKQLHADVATLGDELHPASDHAVVWADFEIS